LLQAREFRESARSLVTLAQSKSFNPAVTLMVTEPHRVSRRPVGLSQTMMI
jgi:hypothetical protein